jgi:hypothetical protein
MLQFFHITSGSAATLFQNETQRCKLRVHLKRASGDGGVRRYVVDEAIAKERRRIAWRARCTGRTGGARKPTERSLARRRHTAGAPPKPSERNPLDLL